MENLILGIFIGICLGLFWGMAVDMALQAHRNHLERLKWEKRHKLAEDELEALRSQIRERTYTN